MEKKAILIGVGTYPKKLEESMWELRNLAKANNISLAEIITQPLQKPNNATYFGKGKIQEVCKIIDNDKSINYLIANDELSPSQVRNIEELLTREDVVIIDRTLLILDIFSQRARTREAKLQVKIALLQHELAHLVSSDEGYDQQRGGGTSNRGSGEKKIDTDRRVLNKKIQELKKEIEQSEVSRFEQRKQRVNTDKYLVSLVGYTNAGKSTLMNKLISEDESKKVFEKDMLFATLATSVRKMFLPNHREILLSDTVGFIEKLPHSLVNSFKTTLEEAIEADLLLHVVDYSNPQYESQIKVTNQTLKEIGVSDQTKMIYIYNKADNVKKAKYPTFEKNILTISAKEDTSIEMLKEVIQNSLYPNNKTYNVVIPYNMYKDLDYFIRNVNVYEMDDSEEGVVLKVDLTQEEADTYKDYIKSE
ncbi:GTPase HflX [Mycoplasma sp. P36-A1]|uniref:GTPase HflX n=1 Tax=Mycoplasma sp. P36-A1 TaxID=3252900 RepID=UPI003C2DD4D1